MSGGGVSAVGVSGEAEGGDGGRIVVVTGRQEGVLLTVLAERGRPTQVVSSAVGVTDSADGVLGIAVLPDAAEDLLAAAGPLLRACHEAELPTIAVGTAAGALAEVLGCAFDGSSEPGLTTVTVTEQADEDPMMAPTPSGVAWVVRGSLRPSDGTTVLATAGDDPVVVVSGESYLVALDPMVADDEIDAMVQAETLSAAGGSFLRAHGAALLGRWVDLVVGRTEEEMPWGRRGPQPVAAPGLSLNPA